MSNASAVKRASSFPHWCDEIRVDALELSNQSSETNCKTSTSNQRPGSALPRIDRLMCYWWEANWTWASWRTLRLPSLAIINVSSKPRSWRHEELRVLSHPKKPWVQLTCPLMMEFWNILSTNVPLSWFFFPASPYEVNLHDCCSTKCKESWLVKSHKSSKR